MRREEDGMMMKGRRENELICQCVNRGNAIGLGALPKLSKNPPDSLRPFEKTPKKRGRQG